MAESSARVGVEFQKERIIYQCCFHFRLSCYNKSSNAKKLIGEGWVFGMLKQGLYEQLINQKLQKKILEARKAEEQRVETGAVDAAESARVLADYVAKLVEKQLTAVAESATKEEAEEEQVRLVNQLLEAIGGADRENLLPLTSEKKVDQLLSVVNTKNSAFAFQNGAVSRGPVRLWPRVRFSRGQIMSRPCMWNWKRKLSLRTGLTYWFLL